jgi:IS30 family transposase
MCKQLKIEVTFDKIPSKKQIEEHVKMRINSRPKHLKGAEVQRIAAEMEVCKETVYRILNR